MTHSFSTPIYRNQATYRLLESAASSHIPTHPQLGQFFCPALAESAALAWGGLGHGPALAPGPFPPMAMGVPDMRIPAAAAQSAATTGDQANHPTNNQCSAESPVTGLDNDSGFAAAIGHPQNSIRDPSMLRDSGETVPDPAHSHPLQHMPHFHPARNAIPIPSYIPMVSSREAISHFFTNLFRCRYLVLTCSQFRTSTRRGCLVWLSILTIRTSSHRHDLLNTSASTKTLAIRYHKTEVLHEVLSRGILSPTNTRG